MGLFYFMLVQQDTSSFVAALRLASGESGVEDRLFRLTKPLALLLPIIFYQLGVSAIQALWIQQILSWCLLAFFSFRIFHILFDNPRQAWVGTLALLFCQPIAVYGLAALVDMAGWAFMFGIVYFVLRYQHKLDRIQWLIALGLLLGLGIFVKESVLLAGLYTFFFLLYQSSTLLTKLKQYLVIGFSFFLVFVIGSGITWLIWETTIYHWVLFNQDTPPPSSLYHILLQTYRTLDVFWFLVLVGVLHYGRDRSQYGPLLSFVSTATVGMLVFPFLWHYHYDRILFMNTIFLLPLVVVGSQLLGRFQLVLVLLGGMMNLLVAFGIYKFQMGGLIITAAGMFLMFSLVFYYLNIKLKKKTVNL
jgi:hypothetical protein